MQISGEYQLGLFCFGIFLIIAGVYGSLHFLKFTRQYDAAMGVGGQSVKTTILAKQAVSTQSEIISERFSYNISIKHKGVEHKINIEENEYNLLQEGDTILLRYHAQYPNFFATPLTVRKTTTPTLVLFGAIFLLGLGVIGFVLKSVF
jgi:hypothetical protein